MFLKKKQWFERWLLLSAPFLCGFHGPLTFGGGSFALDCRKVCVQVPAWMIIVQGCGKQLRGGRKMSGVDKGG